MLRGICFSGLAVSIPFLLFHSSTLFGQGSARIAGIVTDPAGAIVSRADVTLTEVSTGTTRKMQTSSEDSYGFLDLPPATYTLSAGAP